MSSLLTRGISMFVLALLFILMSVLISAPKLWAQGLNCEEVNGLMWCYDPQACGKPCNEVCGIMGTEPIADNTVWFQAQNTVAKCQAISDAFGLFDTVNVSVFSIACLEDSQALNQNNVNGNLNPPLNCSTLSGCPESHRTQVDLNIDCDGGGNSQQPTIRSICPCQPCDELFPCGKKGDKGEVCHVPPGNPENAHTICISPNALDSHLENHEDFCGPCEVD